MKRAFKAIGIIVIVVLLIGGCSYGVYKYKVSQSGSLNVLIIGIDSREGLDGARSDSLMVAHIDQDHKEIKLISIPRDAYVHIPSVDRNDKITHAYAYAKKEGTIETMEYLFETDFEYYIEVDFEKMIALVDSIGGIDLTPTATFCEMDEKDNAQSYCFEEGQSVHMNGAMALSYSRHRKSDSDLYRAARQQEVIKAMVSKVKSSGVFDIYNFYKDVKEISDTNLDLWELIGYADMAFNDFRLEQEVAEGQGMMMWDEYYGQDLYFFILDETWAQEKIEYFQR
ncbi:LCP family protein required for cell wall assembly [Breznakia sp. PF5-3]|uniref:LCP family protein n=1 Tax=unclassified Breznakia TaxID=2623764 RepID=UPI002405D8B3|nr:MULTISPECIES: LCP family protein [unclassified Breznakia]MDF9824027.1 LCP family protein required for cell wall assembly [Breznakia sp. PM6-1]MDF9834826.1 LCP family protein required for cell wall assembly [Breznakia sp. PF5-3]MDF9838145.1 LCP family protein required for cell wall assembly [Breznakia sp. PFB2-8]MDF9860131.1 LCP family protein required for cell wall assembly [Breznakia sp. PH5-24]